MKLPARAFFSPSTRFTFDDADGVRWVTDTHVIARADHVRTITGIEHRDEFRLPLIEAVTRGQAIGRLGQVLDITDEPEAYVVGTPQVRLHHDPRLWDAWTSTVLAPHLALSAASPVPMVEWTDIDERTIGWTALRRLPPTWGLS